MKTNKNRSVASSTADAAKRDQKTRAPKETEPGNRSAGTLARMCIACRKYKPRIELIRITAETSSGLVKINQTKGDGPAAPAAAVSQISFVSAETPDSGEPPTASLSAMRSPAHGRSAYVCKSEICVTQALKGTRLKHALEGRKAKNLKNRRTIKWPLEPQLIQHIFTWCTEP